MCNNTELSRKKVMNGHLCTHTQPLDAMYDKSRIAYRLRQQVKLTITKAAALDSLSRTHYIYKL